MRRISAVHHWLKQSRCAETDGCVWSSCGGWTSGGIGIGVEDAIKKVGGGRKRIGGGAAAVAGLRCKNQEFDDHQVEGSANM